MNTSIFRLESSDFEEMEQALSAWSHEYRQISPGAFHGSILHTQTGSLGILRNRWERAIHYRGTAPKGTIGLAISLAQTGDARWMGQRVGIDDMIVQRTGAEAEYLSAPLWDSVVFAVPEVELAQHIADLLQDDPEEVLQTHGVICLKPQTAARLRRAGLVYLDTAARFLNSRSEPSPLPQMAESAVRLIAHALASSHTPNRSQKVLARRRQLISKAEEFCRHQPDQPLRIGELCREIGVSERTLRYTFRELTGQNASDYLMAQRLNRAHRALRHADPAEMLIKQIAYSNGFTHLGHFARNYKKLFAESPSQTLHRMK
jgi:AraC family ethanolamine operon transcriptional activator